MTLQEKKSAVLKKRACLICLRVGRFAQNCKAFVKCTGCDRKHYHLFCPELDKKHEKKSSEEVKPADGNVEVNAVNSNQVSGGLVLLKTLVVTLFKKKVRILFDDGSQKSYIRNSNALRKCECIGSHLERNELFGGALTDVQKRHTYKVPLQSLDGKVRQEVILTDQPKIAGNIPRVPYGPWIEELKQKKIWLSDTEAETDEIDILIGADIIPKLRTGKSEEIQGGLVAIETVFGWTLMGPVPNQIQKSVAMTVTSLHVSELSCSQLWDLDAIGIKDPAENKSKLEKEAEVKDHFVKTVTRNEDGRYCVSLPWVGGTQDIPSNKKVAEARLGTTTRKLKNDQMDGKYGQIFKSWEEESFVEEVSHSGEMELSCHYLPHRAVYKPDSRTTPVRPVFDASCKVGRNPSLNDCLEKGPNFIELIPSIMHRFREGKIGVISDIRKAFQMIDVQPKDQEYLRFLWWEDEECTKLKILKHKRVVFGVNCRPFLLGAVIDFHLKQSSEQDQPTARKLLKSFYVDNCVTSVNTVDEYNVFKLEATRIMAEAKMELREWECSAEETFRVGQSSSERCGLDVVSTYLASIQTSVLGMKWDKFQDTLRCYEVPEVPTSLTKRILLSVMQRIFDPMGFLSPAMLVPKMVLQEAWTQKVDWDEELPVETSKKMKFWIEEIGFFEKIQIPRSMAQGQITEGRCQLHMFMDACQYGYAAVAFIRTEYQGNVSVHIMQAKARVAPLKTSTIPRLELLGCSIGARLCKSIKDSLSSDLPTFLWSDSTTALAWIKRNNEWGTFVGNRVREICTLTNPEDWRHVPGIYNPADLPSRGCTPRELFESRWWEGPRWLRLPREEWPTEVVAVDEDMVLLEKKKKIVKVPMLYQGSAEDPWYAKRSSYMTCIKIFAYTMTFLKRTRRECIPNTSELSIQEIEVAERRVFRLIQEEAFPMESKVVCGLKVKKEDSLLCVVTKLTNRDDTQAFKMPVLLPHTHPLVDRMIREEHVKSGHAGVQLLMSKIREKCWIVQSRKAIRKIVQSCVTCRRYNSKAPTVPVAPLPENRIKDARVFEVTGVDLAGPLFLKDKTKVWIVLFTCAVYRAVHMELVSSLNTDSFLLALMRFISRRGRPSVIYSDNGTNFVGAVNLFKQMDWKRIVRDTQTHRIQWIFNPPSAAWWGGWWERLMRTVKDLLKKMLGHGKLNYIQLETCLLEVEAAVNARPLTYVTEDHEDFVPLTPSMFLQDIKNTVCPEVVVLKSGDLRRKYRELVVLKEELRSRFRIEYLGQLVQKGKASSSREFHVGEVVLVASDNRKRMEWPMAKILQLLPGKDGGVRVARIRTSSGEFIRPLQRLIPLEVQSESTCIPISPEIIKEAKKVNSQENTAKGKVIENKVVEPEVMTRTGRKVKVPARFK